MCWGCPDPTSERIAQPRIKPNRLDFLATASALWMLAIPAWWRPAHLHEVHPDNCGVIPMGGARAVRRGWRALLKVLHSLARASKPTRDRTMWTSTQSELREIVWLASAVGALSILGTGLAVALALVLAV